MELIRQHINTCTNLFINIENIYFNEIFLNIKNDKKEDFIKILRYLDRLISLSFEVDDISLKKLHINFSTNFSLKERDLIAQFLLLKFHFFNLKFKSDNLEGLDDEIQVLKSRIKNFCYPARWTREYPNGVKTIEYNKLVDSHKKNKTLLQFYESINKKLIPKLLFNSTIQQIQTLKNIFEYCPIAIELNDTNYSTNLLNANKTLNDIDNINDKIINGLETIVIFDCERKGVMTNFSFDEINKWNTDYDTRFTKFLIITFGKDFSCINHTRNKIALIRERFKIPINTTYTITNSEIDFLLNRKAKSSPSIEFISDESFNFWDTFVLETSIRELYELRSIKLMNIYSICYTDEIKNYLISDLFSKKESSELISSTTKLALLELRDEDIEVLKKSLSGTLDFIINSDIKSKVLNSLSITSVIVLDEAILINENLLSEIRNALGLTELTKFKTWSDLINLDLNDFLILSYRDQGRYPNYYFPNLLEIEFGFEKYINVILLNFLFAQHYNWSKYNLYKDYHKLLTHPIRDQHFEWNTLKNKIQELKPEQKLNIDWDLENEYSNSDQRDSYKLKLKGKNVKTVYNSDLFILTDDTKIHYKVVKIDYLLSLDTEDSKIFIQNIDEIQENINIYDKMVDKKQQKAELEVIRKQFNLGDETAGRLWKVLLKKLAEAQGEDQLYSKLKNHFESKGIKIVSQFHFKNSWINPQSESIAPLSKRVFIELCEYLEIPKIYFIIIQRIRNSSRQSSRQSTKQMNQLLRDLFNDGCFDDDKTVKEIILNRLEYYKTNHPLDEIGIDEAHLADNLLSLIKLIKPELNLLKLETINKVSNE